MMELGALICTPINPDCDACPLKSDCIARIEDRIGELPPRKEKAPKRSRYFHYIVALDKDHTWIRRREGKGIWEGLHEFPYVETSGPKTPEELFSDPSWKEKTGGNILPTSFEGPIRHILSHQVIHAIFYRFEGFTLPGEKDYIRVHLSELEEYPLPKLILSYLEKFLD
jgi:A/G-specific adenine glycosylase